MCKETEHGQNQRVSFSKPFLDALEKTLPLHNQPQKRHGLAVVEYHTCKCGDGKSVFIALGDNFARCQHQNPKPQSALKKCQLTVTDAAPKNSIDHKPYYWYRSDYLTLALAVYRHRFTNKGHKRSTVEDSYQYDPRSGWRLLEPLTKRTKIWRLPKSLQESRAPPLGIRPDDWEKP